MKKALYTIEFESCERSMTSQIHLSKTAFNEQLKRLKHLAMIDRRGLPTDNDIEEYEPKAYRHEHHTECIHEFRCVTGFVILTEYICDEGYSFTSNSKRVAREEILN